MNNSIMGIKTIGVLLILLGWVFSYILYNVVMEFDNPANWLSYLSLGQRFVIVGDRFDAWVSAVGLSSLIIICTVLGFLLIINGRNLYITLNSWKGRIIRKVLFNIIMLITALYGITIILMYASMGFLFGCRGVLQRFGLMKHNCGDGNYQILLNFSGAVIGFALICIVASNIVKNHKIVLRNSFRIARFLLRFKII